MTLQGITHDEMWLIFFAFLFLANDYMIVFVLLWLCWLAGA